MACWVCAAEILPGDVGGLAAGLVEALLGEGHRIATARAPSSLGGRVARVGAVECVGGVRDGTRQREAAVSERSDEDGDASEHGASGVGRTRSLLERTPAPASI